MRRALRWAPSSFSCRTHEIRSKKMAHPSRKITLTNSLLLIFFWLFLYILLPAGGFFKIIFDLFPEKIRELILFLNGLPGGRWTIAGSQIYWHNERLPFSFYATFIFEIFPLLLFLLISFGAARLLKISYHEIGIIKSLGKQGNRRALILGILSGLVVFCVFALLGPTLFVREGGFYFKWMSFNWERVNFLRVIFFAPILEEFFFRGIFFAIFEKHFPVKIIWPVSAFFFGMTHLIADSLYMAILISIMGLYFGWLYMKTRSLILPILAHAVANVISTCVIVVRSY